MTLISLIALPSNFQAFHLPHEGSEILSVAVKSQKVLDLGFRCWRHDPLDSILESGVRFESKHVIDGGLLERNSVG